MADSQSLSLGVVGAGFMGGAIVRAAYESGLYPNSSIFVAEVNEGRRKYFEDMGIRSFEYASELLAQKPDIVVFAVKPQVLPSVLSSLEHNKVSMTVISIAAGTPLANIESMLPRARVIRAMPNLPAQVRCGATALTPGRRAEETDIERARTLFSALGVTAVMTEEQLDVMGVVSSCAPAFYALFVDCLTRAGVRYGLNAVMCRQFVEKTMEGCAIQLQTEGLHPREYMEQVCSPGGTTAAALQVLEMPLFEGMHDAVHLALKRTAELAQKGEQ